MHGGVTDLHMSWREILDPDDVGNEIVEVGWWNDVRALPSSHPRSMMRYFYVINFASKSAGQRGSGYAVLIKNVGDFAGLRLLLL